MSQVALDDATIEQLRSAVGGQVITPEDAEYDALRKVWNGMIDCHPAVIVRCASTDDVVAAVNFGREHDLARLGARRRATRPPATARCDDGIVIDLAADEAASRSTPSTRTARVGAARPGPTSTPPRRSTGSR